jgi:hypothetical protein
MSDPLERHTIELPDIKLTLAVSPASIVDGVREACAEHIRIVTFDLADFAGPSGTIYCPVPWADGLFPDNHGVEEYTIEQCVAALHDRGITEQVRLDLHGLLSRFCGSRESAGEIAVNPMPGPYIPLAIVLPPTFVKNWQMIPHSALHGSMEEIAAHKSPDRIIGMHAIYSRSSQMQLKFRNSDPAYLLRQPQKTEKPPPT